MIAISFTLELSQRPAARGPGIYGRSSSRDAQLPAGLYADGFGGAMMAVTGCTKNSSHKRHTQEQPSVFGIDNVDITLSGISPRQRPRVVEPPLQAPGMPFKATLFWIADG